MKKKQITILAVLCAVVIVALLVGLAVFIRTCRPSCASNLVHIDTCKEQFALASGGTNLSEISVEDLEPWLDTPWRELRCPKGGIYSINEYGVDPTCSHPGHTL